MCSWCFVVQKKIYVTAPYCLYDNSKIVLYSPFSLTSITHSNEEQPPTEDLDIDSNWDEATESFDAMDLPEELLRGIYAYGFEKPSAIQQRAIKPTMLGRDLIAQAQSGTVGHLYDL